jgi:hypothetical protein
MPEKDAGSEKPAVIDGTKSNEPEMTEDGKEIISVRRGRDSEGYHAKLGNPEQLAQQQNAAPAGTTPVSPEPVMQSTEVPQPQNPGAVPQSAGAPQPLGPQPTEQATETPVQNTGAAPEAPAEKPEEKPDESDPFAAEFKKRAYKAPDDTE